MGCGEVGENIALVVAPLALPPPVTGQTLINASVARRLMQGPGIVRLINISPMSHFRTMAYHLRRITAVLALPFVLAANACHERRSLYAVVEPGHGMIYNFLIVSVARIFGYKIVLHHHASSYAKIREARFACLCSVAGRGATHVALCEEMAQDLKARYRSCRQVIVVHNACHIPDPGVIELTGQQREFTIGFLSNLSLEKGLDTVLQSYGAIRTQGVNARLLLAGPIMDAGAKHLISAAQQKYGSSLVELGPVSGATKKAFFESLDVFLFPSRYRIEAQPLVVLEALSYGVPALVTRQGYSAEIVDSLGTACDAPTFVKFAAAFVLEWMRDGHFAVAQRAAARARFLELMVLSRNQTSQLLALLKGTAA